MRISISDDQVPALLDALTRAWKTAERDAAAAADENDAMTYLAWAQAYRNVEILVREQVAKNPRISFR